jgi:hypothetical protein
MAIEVTASQLAQIEIRRSLLERTILEACTWDVLCPRWIGEDVITAGATQSTPAASGGCRGGSTPDSGSIRHHPDLSPKDQARTDEWLALAIRESGETGLPGTAVSDWA